MNGGGYSVTGAGVQYWHGNFTVTGAGMQQHNWIWASRGRTTGMDTRGISTRGTNTSGIRSATI